MVALVAYEPRIEQRGSKSQSPNDLRVQTVTRGSSDFQIFVGRHGDLIAACIRVMVLIALRRGHLRRRPRRLGWPRTPDFQSGNTGSNPVGDTTQKRVSASRLAATKTLRVHGFATVFGQIRISW